MLPGGGVVLKESVHRSRYGSMNHRATLVSASSLGVALIAQDTIVRAWVWRAETTEVVPGALVILYYDDGQNAPSELARVVTGDSQG